MIFITLPGRFLDQLKLTVLSAFIPLKTFADNLLFLGRKLLLNGSTSYSEKTRFKLQIQYLREKIKRLVEENIKLKLRLQNLAKMKETIPEYEDTLIFADVILPSEPFPWRKSLIISKGASDGIKIGMPVVWADHLVGKIIQVSRLTSRVQLITDPDFKVAAMPLSKNFSETAPQPQIGILQGTNTEYCELKWILGDIKLQKGWIIITAQDPINNIPKGLTIGKIKELNLQHGPYYQIKVKPLIKLTRLEHVIVLTGSDEID
jgi:rod shape-determining protein MreC